MVTLIVLRLCAGVTVYYTAVQQMETLSNGPSLNHAAGSTWTL